LAASAAPVPVISHFAFSAVSSISAVLLLGLLGLLGATGALKASLDAISSDSRPAIGTGDVFIVAGIYD
jgi:hypothetical protein